MVEVKPELNGKDEINEVLIKFIQIIYHILIFFGWLMMYLIVMMGSLSSILILYKLYPNLAQPIIKFMTIWRILFLKIVPLLISLLIVFLTILGIYNLLKINKQSNEKRKQRYWEEFRKEMKNVARTKR